MEQLLKEPLSEKLTPFIFIPKQTILYLMKFVYLL